MHRAVRPGTRKGPTAPPGRPVPLHVGEPPRHQATAQRAGSGGVQHVVARGVVGGEWALAGARHGTTPKLSGREGASPAMVLCYECAALPCHVSPTYAPISRIRQQNP